MTSRCTSSCCAEHDALFRSPVPLLSRSTFKPPAGIEILVPGPVRGTRRGVRLDAWLAVWIFYNPHVHALWWTILGVILGGMIMLPVIRLALRETERRARHAERRALDAERLAELGSMTGGLAHEIKNPLSTVGLNAQLLAEGLQDAELPPEERERLTRRLDTLRREVERLRDILEDFLQFAGRVRLDPKRVDLRDVVAELIDFYVPQCAQHGVTLRSQFSDDPAWVTIDTGLFKQALLNLMINATQAMSSMREPDVTTPHDDGVQRELMIRVASDDAVVRVHVIDTGPGIEPERIAEIFRPYVSSKSGGTGLGLPTSRRIIAEHGGELDVYSEPGRGSDFVITLSSATDDGVRATADQRSR